VTHAENPSNALNAMTASDWHWQLQNAVRTPDELLRRLPEGGEDALPDGWQNAARHFPMLVTPYYLSLVRDFSQCDPVFRQVMPDPEEIDPQWAADPDALAEHQQSPVPRLIHRYPNRAVLLTTDACAVRCRHCLRKRRWHFGEARISTDELDAVVGYLTQTPEIGEVLVSGGDPLTLETEDLREILAALRSVPSIRVLRLGTRVPVVLPQRITDELCVMLKSFPGLWCATHFNHPREITEAAVEACRRLTESGVALVNQTVLLRGVNDDADTLVELSWRLLENGVKPYYLFHGDPIDGTRHFRTGLSRALEIARSMKKRLSGLAMPTLAFDLPGGQGKVVLEPGAQLGSSRTGTFEFTGLDGTPVFYPDR
jgi:lysine 2,3-aminomutase